MIETSAKIIADSISPAGHRFTTFEVVYPRIVLAEVNTHRALSRVSASSRAVPVEKMIRRVTEDPYVPTHWGKNQKGMQAELEFDDADDLSFFDETWRSARNEMVRHVKMLSDRGLHKQIANRLIEAFMWHPTVISATEWSNFFHLRDHKDAHPDFRDLAHAMREVCGKSEPKRLSHLDWHLPYITDADDENLILGAPEDPSAVLDTLRKISVGRCARVSTLTHEGEYDLQADVNLHDKMYEHGHMSPYENVARPMTPDELELFKRKKMRWEPAENKWLWTGRYTHFLGNVQGWVQLRKMIPHEEDILGAQS